MRKIIQIASSQTGEHNYARHLVALCDDGTVWEYDCVALNWVMLRPIPDEEAAAE